jgi:hypothetical protein
LTARRFIAACTSILASPSGAVVNRRQSTRKTVSKRHQNGVVMTVRHATVLLLSAGPAGSPPIRRVDAGERRRAFRQYLDRLVALATSPVFLLIDCEECIDALSSGGDAPRNLRPEHALRRYDCGFVNDVADLE